ncbi:MAG: TIGR00153 family protein [Lentisphaerae bacterium]|nr:TIGR00153 family protein [Lentisphaerota bacterium]
MQSLDKLFGVSPFAHVVEHAQKIHQCVTMIPPVARAVLAGDLDNLRQMQDRMSLAEYEADQIKDKIRINLPKRFFLPVQREDVLNLLRQLDRMGDDSEDFAVVATFRRLDVPEGVKTDFLSLVDKVVAVSEALLGLVEQLAALQRESFEGPETESVLAHIDDVCRMEWETDKLSRRCARGYYGLPSPDPVTVILLEKLCRALTGIADHAENVGKSLRLMILRG